jgi:hypothetical protein
MRDIIEDPAVGAHFAVLLIVRLGQDLTLEGSVTIYQPGKREFRGNLILEHEYDETA